MSTWTILIRTGVSSPISPTFDSVKYIYSFKLKTNPQEKESSDYEYLFRCYNILEVCYLPSVNETYGDLNNLTVNFSRLKTFP